MQANLSPLHDFVLEKEIYIHKKGKRIQVPGYRWGESRTPVYRTKRTPGGHRRLAVNATRLRRELQSSSLCATALAVRYDLFSQIQEQKGAKNLCFQRPCKVYGK